MAKAKVKAVKFPQEFLNKLKVAGNKGVKVTIETIKNQVVATATANGRQIGKMICLKKGNKITSVRSNVIERDYFPLEAITAELSKIYEWPL